MPKCVCGPDESRDFFNLLGCWIYVEIASWTFFVVGEERERCLYTEEYSGVLQTARDSQKQLVFVKTLTEPSSRTVRTVGMLNGRLARKVTDYRVIATDWSLVFRL